MVYEVIIQEEKDIVTARQKAREAAKDLKFGLVDQTRIITAVSELSRNIFEHAEGGKVIIEDISEGIKYGLMVTFEDHGPGIHDIRLVMKEGYTTGSGMGLGLSGSKKLMDEFEIHSTLGKGTKIVVKKWL